MRKLLSLLVVAAVAMQLAAAPVDPSAAQRTAEQYLKNKVYTGKTMAPAATQAKLIKTEMGEKAQKPVYYIFNTETTFVIVAGDDRAEEVLAYGDRPLNLDRIPTNMQAWLNGYKRQIDWLLTHPDVKVEKPTTFKAPGLKANVYGPLLTCLWDQTEPYWDQCKFTYSGTTYQCYTGCPATSASMVMYYWKYPTSPVGPMPAYSASLDLSYYNSVNYTYAALPQVTFDWDNMKDHYGTWKDENGITHNETYTAEQGAAVATLMRYVGQAEHMMYGTAQAGGSGIYTTDAQIVADMYIGFGYDENTTRLVQKGNFTEAQWAQLLQTEMIESRPVVFMAVDNGAGGHAFNVDGYDANTNKYHINFGWSGDGNNWCAMNAFADGEGYNFNSDQQMIIGIQPGSGIIIATPEQLDFTGYVGETYTQTLHVTAREMESNITITKSGSNDFTVSPTTITPAQAQNGYDVTVTYKPTAAGNPSASLTLSATGVDDVTVPINAVAKPRVPTLVANPTTLNFVAKLGKTVSKTIDLTGVFLTDNVSITLNDPNGVFTVNPTNLAAGSFNGETPQQVTVNFKSDNEGNYNATLTFASAGAENVEVTLTANANDGGTAIDPYLDIAKYETIDEAGFSGLTSLYKYTEYPEQECAWLTVSNYGAMTNTATQKWITHEGTMKEGNELWNATDIFLGNTAYGTSKYADWNENYQTFYVTNCTQVKQYAYNKGSSYPLKMTIYECTLNNDGSITPGNTAVDSKQSSVYSATEVIASGNLDPTKIYMVKIYNDYSHLYEIGFKTPISTIDAPVATAATEVAATGFIANWNPVEGANSYTLRVMPKPDYIQLITENFTNCTASGSQDVGSKLDDYLDNPGWTGSKLYTAVGGIRMGTGSATGTLTSPALDLSQSGGKVSIKLKVKTFNNDTNCDLKISCGDATATITVPSNEEIELVQVLDCTAQAGQNVTFETVAKSKRVVITGVELYSGEYNTEAKAAGEMIFTGITANKYNVTGLQPATTYLYDVKALIGTEQSHWSNVIEVLTLGGVVGDVNGDGETNSGDITALYNFLLTGDMSAIVNGDQDGDGEITSGDVTVVYAILLGVEI